jgi:hypothetical protein
LNHKLIGITLLPIGLFLLIIGGIFLPIGVNDYNRAVNASSTIPMPACATRFGTPSCPSTFAEAETLIIESAAALSIGVAALVGGFFLLRLKPISRDEAAGEITR